MVTPLDAYQKRLVAFLSVATFFEGYDFFALSQILPELLRDLSLTPKEGGMLLAVINFGTVLAALVVRQADRFGRRTILSVTIIGYTVFSLFTAAATSPIAFGVFQLVARTFLVGEWAVAMIIAAEEFPADRRATVIGIIQASATVGAVACAGLVPLLSKVPVLGWRSVYVVGAIPLIIVAILRRGMRETRRFAEKQATGGMDRNRLLAVLTGPYRNRVLLLGLIWALTYVCTQSAILFWKQFVVTERGFTNEQEAASILIGTLVALPLMFFAGKALDVMGRKVGGAVMFSVTALGVFGSYTLHGQVPLTIALVFAVFGTTAVLPVLNAYTTELFPTEVRSDAFALANNVFGRVGFVIAPLLVGLAAEQYGYGNAVALTGITPIVALVLILAFLPETRGKELEATSAVASH
ncbi:MAG: MFS transporter [Archangium sp.]|nr:MFS transporter [Archangium sp.]